MKKISGEWYFLSAVLLLYVIILLVNHDLFSRSIGFFLAIFWQILPIFVLVFALMVVSNIIINQKIITKYFKKPGIKKWVFVIVAGILSTGPIYLWYPLLAELRDRGVGHGFLATFLYNRAIKIPLLPVAIFYFGVKYVFILTLMMIVFSVFQGMLIDRLVSTNK